MRADILFIYLSIYLSIYLDIYTYIHRTCEKNCPSKQKATGPLSCMRTRLTPCPAQTNNVRLLLRARALLFVFPGHIFEVIAPERVQFGGAALVLQVLAHLIHPLVLVLDL